MAMKIEKDTEKKLQVFNKNVSVAAEEVIFRVFPAKILELQDLIDSTDTLTSPFHISHAAESTDTTVYAAPSAVPLEPESKKRKLTASTNGTASPGKSDTRGALYPELVHANKHIQTVHARIKAEVEDLTKSCDKIKLWVNLNMPRIEDGDNFGVGVQEEVLAELNRAQDSCYNLRDAARQHYLHRAKICSKHIKYPHVEDYELALKEHDEKQLYLARQHIYDLRNIYAILTDIIHKNIVKLRSPKGNNADAMY